MTVILPIWLVLVVSHVDELSPRESALAAAQANDVRELGASLASGADVNSRDEIGFTPLMVAARAGNLDAAAYLIANGADVNARAPVCGTALAQASLYGHIAIVRLLLAHHADPRLKNNDGITALDYAMMSSSATPELIACLRGAGAPRGSNKTFSLSG